MQLKKITFVLLSLLTTLKSGVMADNFIREQQWYIIMCETTIKHDKPSPRTSDVIYPQVLYSNPFILIRNLSGFTYNTQILIVNSQGTAVKRDSLNINMNDDIPYYIGDLDSGNYEIRIETEEWVLTGIFEISL